MCNKIRPRFTEFTILDSGANLSDYIPVIGLINLPALTNFTSPELRHNGNNHPIKSRRWDKCNLAEFYEVSRIELQKINIPKICLSCKNGCNCMFHQTLINNVYNSIVMALVSTANNYYTVPCFSSSVLKAFWTEELNDLKHESIFWHDIWLSSGHPVSGWLYIFKTSCKYKYKLGIKQAYLNYESKFSDEFCSHFLNKDLPQFWMSWNKQFRKNITKQI